ncbi:transposase, partial [Pseudomonas syringae pv. pisi str. 1704B]
GLYRESDVRPLASDFFMPIQQQLLDLGDLFNFSDLSTFTQNIPIEWVVRA